MQKDNLNEINLNGGVLIIGSLLWDDKKQTRKDWRKSFLKIDDKVKIPAPIRYGRISTSRCCTFTMVLSQECNDKDKLGKAFFCPF